MNTSWSEYYLKKGRRRKRTRVQEENVHKRRKINPPPGVVPAPRVVGNGDDETEDGGGDDNDEGGNENDNGEDDGGEDGDDDEEGKPFTPDIPKIVAAFKADLRMVLHLPDGPETEKRLDDADIADALANRMLTDLHCSENLPPSTASTMSRLGDRHVKP